MRETDREALETVISEELATIAAYNSTAQPGQHLTGRGIVQMLAVAVDGAGFTRTPQPHVVETVEELRGLDPDLCPAYIGGTFGFAYRTTSNSAVRDEVLADRLPATVLTPATQPTASEPTEAQVEAAAEAILADYGADGWYGRSKEEQAVVYARAALEAAAKVGGE